MAEYGAHVQNTMKALLDPRVQRWIAGFIGTVTVAIVGTKSKVVRNSFANLAGGPAALSLPETDVNKDADDLEMILKEVLKNSVNASDFVTIQINPPSHNATSNEDAYTTLAPTPTYNGTSNSLNPSPGIASTPVLCLLFALLVFIFVNIPYRRLRERLGHSFSNRYARIHQYFDTSQRRRIEEAALNQSTLLDQITLQLSNDQPLHAQDIGPTIEVLETSGSKDPIQTSFDSLQQQAFKFFLDSLFRESFVAMSQENGQITQSTMDELFIQNREYICNLIKKDVDKKVLDTLSAEVFHGAVLEVVQPIHDSFNSQFNEWNQKLNDRSGLTAGEIRQHLIDLLNSGDIDIPHLRERLDGLDQKNTDSKSGLEEVRSTQQCHEGRFEALEKITSEEASSRRIAAVLEDSSNLPKIKAFITRLEKQQVEQAKLTQSKITSDEVSRIIDAHLERQDLTSSTRVDAMIKEEISHAHIPTEAIIQGLIQDGFTEFQYSTLPNVFEAYASELEDKYIGRDATYTTEQIDKLIADSETAFQLSSQTQQINELKSDISALRQEMHLQKQTVSQEQMTQLKTLIDTTIDSRIEAIVGERVDKAKGDMEASFEEMRNAAHEKDKKLLDVTTKAVDSLSNLHPEISHQIRNSMAEGMADADAYALLVQMLLAIIEGQQLQSASNTSSLSQHIAVEIATDSPTVETCSDDQNSGSEVLTHTPMLDHSDRDLEVAAAAVELDQGEAEIDLDERDITVDTHERADAPICSQAPVQGLKGPLSASRFADDDHSHSSFQPQRVAPLVVPSTAAFVSSMSSQTSKSSPSFDPTRQAFQPGIPPSTSDVTSSPMGSIQPGMGPVQMPSPSSMGYVQPPNSSYPQSGNYVSPAMPPYTNTIQAASQFGSTMYQFGSTMPTVPNTNFNFQQPMGQLPMTYQTPPTQPGAFYSPPPPPHYTKKSSRGSSGGVQKHGPYYCREDPTVQIPFPQHPHLPRQASGVIPVVKNGATAYWYPDPMAGPYGYFRLNGDFKNADGSPLA